MPDIMSSRPSSALSRLYEFAVFAGQSCQPDCLVAGFWKDMAVFGHLTRRDLHQINPDASLRQAGQFAERSRQLGYDPLSIRYAATCANETVNKNLLAAEQITAHEMIAFF